MTFLLILASLICHTAVHAQYCSCYHSSNPWGLTANSAAVWPGEFVEIRGPVPTGPGAFSTLQRPVNPEFYPISYSASVDSATAANGPWIPAVPPQDFATPGLPTSCGLPPPAAGLSRFRDYEYDSFEGPMLGVTHPLQSFAFPWIWPAGHGELTWIHGSGDGLGMVEFERQLLIGNSMMQPFRLIPSFGTRFLFGPDQMDVPPILAEMAVEFAATWKMAPGWSVDVGIQPSLQGDFAFVDNETFRLKGHAVTALDLDSSTTGILGVVFLGREDIPVLPVGGWIWQPSPDIRWEVVFPRPKLAARIHGPLAPEQWLYVRGELGGNSWSTERSTGERDVLTYRDLRLIAGYEAVTATGVASQIEAGWVFSRKLSYAQQGTSITPGDTFLISLGITY